MMLDNEQDAGTENGQDATQETSSQDDLKSKVEAQNAQIEELNSKLSAFLQAQTPKNENKSLTETEFKELYDKNPQAALDYALESKVNAKVEVIAQHLTAKQQQQFYDEKAEKDFPLLQKDKAFRDMVKEETKNLLSAGMPKDSPKLVYMAAKYAADKHEKLNQTKAANNNGGGSGEAPSNIKKDVTKSYGKNFDKMAEMFGLSDKAKERAKSNVEYHARLEERRRGR